MTYSTAWRGQDEARVQHLELLYRLDGRENNDHPRHGSYAGLIEKYGPMEDWK